jgi:hypothetical protein
MWWFKTPEEEKKERDNYDQRNGKFEQECCSDVNDETNTVTTYRWHVWGNWSDPHDHKVETLSYHHKEPLITDNLYQSRICSNCEIRQTRRVYK